MSSGGIYLGGEEGPQRAVGLALVNAVSSFFLLAFPFFSFFGARDNAWSALGVVTLK